MPIYYKNAPEGVQTVTPSASKRTGLERISRALEKSSKPTLQPQGVTLERNPASPSKLAIDRFREQQRLAEIESTPTFVSSQDHFPESPSKQASSEQSQRSLGYRFGIQEGRDALLAGVASVPTLNESDGVTEAFKAGFEKGVMDAILEDGE